MNERYEGQSLYDILEIPPTAGVQEIYRAYQKVKAAYSPSSPALYTMFTPQEAQELLKLVEEAFQTLSHQNKRKDYDIKNGFMSSMMSGQGYAPATSSTPVTKGSAPVEKPKDAWVGQVKVLKKSDAVLEGFARTKVSVYEIKPEIEAEIASMTEIDGAFLQKIRLYRGVAIEQLVEEMRVTKTMLVALESNDIDALPVAVFTRGFVIQIGRMLGIDEKKLADAYMKYFKARKLG